MVPEIILKISEREKECRSKQRRTKKYVKRVRVGLFSLRIGSPKFQLAVSRIMHTQCLSYGAIILKSAGRERCLTRLGDSIEYLTTQLEGPWSR